MTLIDEMREIMAKVAALPPLPRAIWLNHAVPPGRTFRQWSSDGHLYVWASPSLLDELQHAKAGPPGWGEILTSSLTGIPVIRR